MQSPMCQHCQDHNWNGAWHERCDVVLSARQKRQAPLCSDWFTRTEHGWAASVSGSDVTTLARHVPSSTDTLSPLVLLSRVNKHLLWYPIKLQTNYTTGKLRVDIQYGNSPAVYDTRRHSLALYAYCTSTVCACNETPSWRRGTPCVECGLYCNRFRI